MPIDINESGEDAVKKFDNSANGFNKGLEMSWLAAIFLIPLFFNPSSHQAFYLNKALLFQFLVMVMLGLSIADSIYGRTAPHGWRWRNVIASPLSIATMVFGLVAIVATVASITPTISFWGSWGRKEGLLTLICWILFFLIVSRHLHSRAQLFRAIYALLLSSGIVSILGILQYFFPDILFNYQPTGGRVISTMGNALSLSGFLAMVIPFTMAFIFSPWGKRDNQRGTLITIGATVLLALQFWCLWLAQYSVVMLLYIIAPIIFLTVLGIVKREKLLLGFSAISLLAIGILAAYIIVPLLFPGVESEPTEVKDNKYIVSSESLELDTLGNRAQHWRNTVNMILESPEVPFSNDSLSFCRTFIGYGPETFIATYQNYSPEESKSRWTYSSILLDRPHNHYLYLAATIGLLGLMSFLAILLIFFYLLFRNLRLAKPDIFRMLLIALMASILGHMVDSLFNPSSISTELVFWLMLSMVLIIGRLSPSPEGSNEEVMSEEAVQHRSGKASQLKRTRSYLSTGCAVLLIVIGIGITIRPFLADVQLQRALDLQTMDSERALAAFWKAIELEPNEAVYWGNLGAYSYYMAQRVDEKSSRKELLELSATAYDKARELERYIAYRYYSPADMYLYWAKEGATDKWHTVFSLYDKALQLFPDNAVILNKWALALFIEGDPTEARSKLNRAVSVDPDWSQTAFTSALLLTGEGKNNEAACEMIAPIQETPSNFKYFSDFCLHLNTYDMVQPLEDALEYYTRETSGEWAPHAMLGVTNLCTGNLNTSLDEFNKAMSLVPDKDAGELFKPILKLAQQSPYFMMVLPGIAPEWRAKLSRTPDSDTIILQLDELINASSQR